MHAKSDSRRFLRFAAGDQVAGSRAHVRLVCLPAEADLINKEGAACACPSRARRADRGRFAQLPGKLSRVAAGRGQAGRLRSRSPRHAGAAISLARRARAARFGSQSQGSLHVDHEHAAAALPRAHSGHLCDACRVLYDPTVWDRFDPALMTFAARSQAFRPPEEKVNVLQSGCRQSSRRLFLRMAHTAILRGWSRHRSRPLREPRAAVKLKGTSRSSCRSRSGNADAGNYRCITKDGIRSIRKPCTPTSRPRARCTTGWVKLCSLRRARNDLGAV